MVEGDCGIDVAKALLHVWSSTCSRCNRIWTTLLVKVAMVVKCRLQLDRRVLDVVIYGPHFGEANGSKNHQNSLIWSIYPITRRDTRIMVIGPLKRVLSFMYYNVSCFIIIAHIF